MEAVCKFHRSATLRQYLQSGLLRKKKRKGKNWKYSIKISKEKVILFSDGLIFHLYHGELTVWEGGQGLGKPVGRQKHKASFTVFFTVIVVSHYHRKTISIKSKDLRQSIPNVVTVCQGRREVSREGEMQIKCRTKCASQHSTEHDWNAAIAKKALLML